MQRKVLYLNLDNSVEVYKDEIKLKDIAKIYAQDKKMEEKANETIVYRFMNQQKRQVISVLFLIKTLNELFPEVEIQSVGDKEVLINYNCSKYKKNNIIQHKDKKNLEDMCGASNQNKEKHKNTILEKILEKTKIFFICLISFFGAAFTIMAFHNDIGIRKLFQGVYVNLTGTNSSGFTVLEISYSIGLAVGILVFFNHFGKKKFTDDPTPIEVEMKVYESDINKALIENSDRNGDTL